MSGPVSVQVRESSGQVLNIWFESEALWFKIVSMSDSGIVSMSDSGGGGGTFWGKVTMSILFDWLAYQQ